MLTGPWQSTAILQGTAGLPGATYADGTEVGNGLHLPTRFKLDLIANVRPIRLYAGVKSVLADWRAGQFDYIIVRENTEGLYASRAAGAVRHATAGSLGMAPSAEPGNDPALFQGAHGSASDIAGQDAASPLATILAGALQRGHRGGVFSPGLTCAAARPRRER